MKELMVNVDLPLPVRNCIKYVWIVFCDYLKIKPGFSQDPTSLRISCEVDSDIQISRRFVDMVISREFQHEKIFLNEPIIRCENGKPDYLGTCFYMLNYLQEYHPSDDEVDEYGRYPYQQSYQYKYSCVHKDLVSQLFSDLRQNTLGLSHIQTISNPSKLFLSHDIDTINSSIFQETKAALKQKNIQLMLSVLAKHILDGPSYLNMDRIMDMHDEYDLKSTFFWLVKKGTIKSPYSGKGIPHADYSISSQNIQRVQRRIKERGFGNGLHKSIHQTEFDSELNQLDEEVPCTRNHYLFVRLPGHFDALEKSHLLLDFSLGFGRMYGHRNSYARPVVPFSIENSRAYSFLEVPLQIMDTTFKYYHKFTARKAQNLIIDFLDAHRHDSVISILWHNDMFSTIKNRGWLQLYKTLLEYAHQHQMSSVTQKELLEERERMVNYFRSNSL